MRRALAEYQIIGARTTLPFARWLMEHPRYIAGDFSTDFIAEEWETRPKEIAREQQDGQVTDGGLDTAQIAAIVGGLLMYEQVEEEKLRRRPVANGSAETSRWRQAARRESLRGL
jgi:acetyl/propionyl-CoA carboxylase alpha subunit